MRNTNKSKPSNKKNKTFRNKTNKWTAGQGNSIDEVFYSKKDEWEKMKDSLTPDRSPTPSVRSSRSRTPSVRSSRSRTPSVRSHEKIIALVRDTKSVYKYNHVLENFSLDEEGCTFDDVYPDKTRRSDLDDYGFYKQIDEFFNKVYRINKPSHYKERKFFTTDINKFATGNKRKFVRTFFENLTFEKPSKIN